MLIRLAFEGQMFSDPLTGALNLLSLTSSMHQVDHDWDAAPFPGQEASK